MYPLSVVLVACRGNILPHVRRELQHASAVVEAEYADADQAIAALSGARDSRIILIDIGSQRLPELRKLHAACPDQPIVALVDAGTNPALITSANRAGASQVVTLPLQTEDFADAMRCLAHLSAPTSGNTGAQVIAVTGVTGGCGATTVAINLAYEIAHLKKLSTILVELSLGRGMLATYLNVEPRFTIHDLLTATERLDPQVVQQALTKINDHLSILAAPHRSIGGQPVSTSGVSQIVDNVKRLVKVVVLDVPCSYDTFHFDALGMADQVILVAEQKVPSVRSLKLLHDSLQRHDGMQTLHLVINRYNSRLLGFSLNDLTKLLKIPKLLTIANDPASVEAAVNRGKPLRLEFPGSPVLADLDALADTLLAGNIATIEQPLGVLSKLARAIGLS